MANGNDIRGFAQLMGEVKLGDTTTDQAARRVEEYVQQELERRCAAVLDLEVGLHPMPLVQRWADDVKRDPAQMAGGMIGRLLGEYALLRRRMVEVRERVAAERSPVPQLPAALKTAEQQLYGALRDFSRTQIESKGDTE